MDDIIKELWVALKALNGPQWIVLLTLATLLGIALFLVFRWLYQARLEAQGSLIDLKDKTIEHYKSIHAERVETRSLSAVLPNAWEPFLAQPYRQLEELFEKGPPQQTMNYTSANMGFILDAELYIHYLRCVHELPSPRAETFRQEQQQWLTERKKFCESSVESHGGSLAPLEYNMAFIEKTRERIVELKACVVKGV